MRVLDAFAPHDRHFFIRPQSFFVIAGVGRHPFVFIFRGRFALAE